MEAPLFSVVIATHNRPRLCRQAVESVLTAAGHQEVVEIIVVDDCSQTPLPDFREGGVKTIRLDRNGGPGPARMTGLRAARGKWVVILDDDDQLMPHAFKTITLCLKTISPYRYWCVAQMARGNGLPAKPFLWAWLDDYLTGRIKGDFTPVIHRTRFLGEGWCYPDSRIGGERLLWWEIARKHGIPTWRRVIGTLGDEAPSRLTHAATQIKHADEHLRLAESTWARFGHYLKKHYPGRAWRVSIAGITYGVLAGKRQAALAFWRGLSGLPKRFVGIFILMCPRFLVASALRLHRQLNA